MIVSVVNVVATCKITKIDVLDVVERINCQYVPQRFAAAIVYVQNMQVGISQMSKHKCKKINVNIYHSTITSTGAEKPDDAIDAIYDTVKKINSNEKKMIEILDTPQISNMTVVAYPQEHEHISSDIIRDGKMVPFFFQVKKKDSKNGATVMVSKSGNITVTGVRTIDDAIDSINRVIIST